MQISFECFVVVVCAWLCHTSRHLMLYTTFTSYIIGIAWIECIRWMTSNFTIYKYPHYYHSIRFPMASFVENVESDCCWCYWNQFLLLLLWQHRWRTNAQHINTHKRIHFTMIQRKNIRFKRHTLRYNYLFFFIFIGWMPVPT